MKQSSFPWIWVGLAALLLLIPGTAGRLLLDVLGGLTLLILLLPLLAAGVGFLAWQVIRRRLNTCPACGTTSLGSQVCPACGTFLGQESGTSGRASDFGSLDPSQVTINVEAVDVDPSLEDDTRASS
jgi:hypothetical protein